MRYRKIDPRVWKDEKFRTLAAPEKLIAIYLITGQSNRIGLFNFSPGQAAEDLQTLPQTFLKGFAKVCQTLNFRFDPKARVLYLPTWFKYNCPENPNVLKACLADLHEVPETPLFAAFSSNLTYLPETFHETFREGLPKPSPKQPPNQEQEQEQYQEQEQDPPLPPQGGARSLRSRVARGETDYPPEFDALWSEYPRRAGTSSKRDALRNWKARVRDGAGEAELLGAVRRYRAFCEATGKVGTETVMQAVRFLGPGEHWKQPWSLPAAHAAPNGLAPMSAAKRDLLEDIRQTRERERESNATRDDELIEFKV